LLSTIPSGFAVFAAGNAEQGIRVNIHLCSAMLHVYRSTGGYAIWTNVAAQINHRTIACDQEML
jgi:mannose/cellobiose epimerase-like protein (N-acyl-D-glucosamine 2-epimerase family)